jgi:hypothetical protein
MDGMKLDEDYRQKNGLGPAAPEPKTRPKNPAERRFTFDAAVADKVENSPEVAKTDTEELAMVEARPTEVGFIDEILSAKDAPKPKKVKPPKPPKPPKVSKIKPASKPQLIEPPKPVKPIKPQKPTAPPKPVSKSVAPQSKLKSKPISRGNLTSQLLTIGKVVIFVAIVVFSLYNFLEVKRLNDLLDTQVGQQSQNDIKNQELISKISDFRLLPQSEYEIYTVKDKSKLVNDPVFEHAENGDKVIVYPDDSLTLVYRESEGKIIGESTNSSLTEKK